MSFEDVVKQLKALSGQKDPESHETGVRQPMTLNLDEATKALRTAHAMLLAPFELKEGQIIRGRKELVEGVLRDWEKPHILLRKLSAPVRITLDSHNVGDAAAPKTYDCVIGTLVRHSVLKGHFFLQYFADSREWEPYPVSQAVTDA